MRIRRLDITGFKSFMDRTVISFEHGVTGVVGPNGCGKSNVVDAIRWVMGEQSAKNLRGRGMEDVIFNGSESHEPLSMAEVTLTFTVEPTDVLSPALAGLPEVSVTRRLFRDGESQYEINRTQSRLLDITDLFLGTGIGTRAYSIIEQGRVGQFVSSRPEDRRALIEEAAGVTKYKARKKAAERKIEVTAANLLRVSDVVAELERQRASLERQAKKAEKYRVFKNEIRDLELHALTHRYLELTVHKQTLEHQLKSLSDNEREAFEAVRRTEEKIETARARLDEHAATIESLGNEVHAHQSQVQLDKQSLEHWTNDRAQTVERIASSEQELESLEGRTQGGETSLRDLEQELVALFAVAREDEVALAVNEEEHRRAVQLRFEVQQSLEQDRAGLVQAAASVANVEASTEHLRAQKLELDSRRAKIQGELEAVRDEMEALDVRRRAAQARFEETQAAEAEISRRRGEEETALNRARDEFAENEVLVISAREELSDKRSRLNSLEELHRNYEGYDRGVRAVMRRTPEDRLKPGVIGLLSELVTAPQRFERAIEALLSSRLQHVVVESFETGVELAKSLVETAEGRATFLPVSWGAEVPLPIPEAVQPLARAVECVSVREDAHRPLVDGLLSNALIFETFEQALAARSLAPSLTLVSLEGDVLAPGGVVTGGVLEGPAVGVLQKKREIDALAAEVARVEARYNEIITRHYSLQKQLQNSEGVLKGLSKQTHEEEVNRLSHQRDLQQVAAELSRMTERRATLQGDLALIDGQLDQVGSEEAGVSGELLHAQAERARREERVRLLSAELESLAARLEELTNAGTGLKVKAAQARQKAEGVEQSVTLQRSQLEEWRARREAVVAERVAAQNHRAALDDRIATTEGSLKEREERLASRITELERARAAQTEAHDAVKVDETKLKSAREQLDTFTHGLSQQSLKERELAMELDHVKVTVNERYACEITEVIGEFHMRPRLTPESEARMKQLRVSIERMGEVNVTAIEEFDEVSKRHEFLSTQKKDLEQSIDRLNKAITTIDKTSRERFHQTFEAVNERFTKIFPRLFGGGRAQLVLTQEAVGQEAGVEIIAEPPGKKLQSVSLLSGGEKALTAVALIFSIFLIKPTPFCLLDEVDAPLDEANVGRYNDMVKEMSTASQFILITHNKRTMEVADTLYGVTMEEPGVSKVVSVKMKESAQRVEAAG